VLFLYVLSLVLQKPITNFAFPFAPLVNWFPEADVLKKRETLRQLVLSLQSRLNPDLQCDLQQGAVPPAPMMPETLVGDMSVGDVCVGEAGDVAVINPVVTASDADSANLLQTSLERVDANDDKLCEESGNCEPRPVLSVSDYLPQHDMTDVIKSTPAVAADAESMTAQTVTASTTVTNCNALDLSLSTISEPPTCLTLSSRTSEKIETTTGSDGVSQGASVSICTSAMMSMPDKSDHSIVSSLTVFEKLISESTDSTLAADAEHVALSSDISVATDRSCTADGSDNNFCQVSDTARFAEDTTSHCIVACVNESFVGNTESQNSTSELSLNT